jgi:hypothetical protein
MTLGWHMVLGFKPALVGCYIWDRNHSFSLVQRSRECVIDVPIFDLVRAVIGVGNSHGLRVDKFAKFGAADLVAFAERLTGAVLPHGRERLYNEGVTPDSPGVLAERLRTAFELYELGESIRRAQLRREHPAATDDEIEALLVAA